MPVLFIFIIIILAVLQLIFPSQMLMFGKRWQFKDGAEPSDAAIFMARLGSVFTIVIALIFLFSTCGQ